MSKDYYLLKDILIDLLLNQLPKERALKIVGQLIDKSEEDGDTWMEIEDAIMQTKNDTPDLDDRALEILDYIENFENKGS